MSPFSQERAEWIEQRLFCLARMAREIRANGYRMGLQVMDSPEADNAFRQAMSSVQAERVQLMAERRVIEEFNADQVLRKE